jgi:hypothetical protein
MPSVGASFGGGRVNGTEGERGTSATIGETSEIPLVATREVRLWHASINSSNKLCTGIDEMKHENVSHPLSGPNLIAC